MISSDEPVPVINSAAERPGWAPLSSNRGEVDHQALIAGQPQTIRSNPDGHFQLFRIGDAIASRNIHAAIYDALRLVKDI